MKNNEKIEETKCCCEDNCSCGCNCEEDCNCGCQNGEECTCDNECNCNCEEECNCDESCDCKDNCCCEESCDCSEEYNCNCNEDCCCEEECSCVCNNNELEEANQKIKDLQEALLRNQADIQNYKRRKEEEISRMLKYSEEDIVKDFLPIIDNFERAIKMDDNDLSDEVSKFLAGFKIIYTNTLSLLQKYEVTEIKAEGLEFDPTYHHAVLTEHDDTKPEGVILEVLQKGYMYKDRVIRPSMVKVNE